MLPDYRSFIETSSDLLVFHVSEDLNILDSSSSARSILGLSTSELKGCAFDLVRRPSAIKDWERKDGTCVKTETILCQRDPTSKCWIVIERVLPEHITRPASSASTSSSSSRTTLAAVDSPSSKSIEEKDSSSGEIDFHSFLAHEARHPLAGVDSSATLGDQFPPNSPPVIAGRGDSNMTSFWDLCACVDFMSPLSPMNALYV
jgi:hypothetical protein